MKILFMGTPEVSAFCLRRLLEREEIVGVVTAPDKPAGRGRRIVFSPVKRLALERKLSLLQPLRLKAKSFGEEVKKLSPELIVTVAFGKILPPEILSLPPKGSINLHFSLLPSYRGPAPVFWAILKGEKETGVTVQQMTAEVDGGEIILQKKVPILPWDTRGSLEEKLSRVGAELLLEAIELIKNGKIKFSPQPREGISYAPKPEKSLREIDWKERADKIYNLVRAFNPSPGAFSYGTLRGKRVRIKIWEVEVVEAEGGKEGEIIEIRKGEGPVVRAKEKALLLKKVQLPGKKIISGYDFVKGYNLKKGESLGGEK